MSTKKQQNIRQSTKANTIISVLPAAKQPSKNLQQNTLATLVQQDTVATVATTNAKLLWFSLKFFFFVFLDFFVFEPIT
jgi:hypothetical protein